MRISNIQNYNSIYFSAMAPTANRGWRTYSEPPKDNEPKESKIPEWFRKSALFSLITLAVINDPATKKFFEGNINQQDVYRNEYFEDVSKFNIPAVKYQLNRLGDVDKPIIKSNNLKNYVLELELDNGKKVEFNVDLNSPNDSILHGYFKTTDNSIMLKYKAIFSSKNQDEFKIIIRNKKNQNYIYGRTPKGELYQQIGNKKVIINKENAEKYQNELKQLKDYGNFEFFTNKNDIWRKLNLILLFLLTVNEWGHDLERKEKETKDKQKYNN